MKRVITAVYFCTIAVVATLFLYSLAGAILEIVEKQYISAAYNGIRAFEHAACLTLAYLGYQIGGRKDD